MESEMPHFPPVVLKKTRTFPELLLHIGAPLMASTAPSFKFAMTLMGRRISCSAPLARTFNRESYPVSLPVVHARSEGALATSPRPTGMGSTYSRPETTWPAAAFGATNSTSGSATT